MNMTEPILYIVLPCFNEEEILGYTIQHLTELYDSLIPQGMISKKSRLLFINDGSRDHTWDILLEGFEKNPYICCVNLAGNVGHQGAILAGMETAKEHADVIITMDADLQDDIYKIQEMLENYKGGADIVYGVRNNRKTDSWFKRTTAQLFYRIMQSLGVKSIYNHADFRLMSKRAVEELFKYRERNLYLRGIIPIIGFNTAVVYEDRKERVAGETKYTLSKMINLAVDGITSFSVKPVRLILGVGLLFLLLALGILIYVLCTFIAGKTVAGWASLMISMWFIGGSILIALGIVGEYIARIYMEVKDRPRYCIESSILK